MQLAYRTHVRTIVERTRLAFARVPERPHAVPIRGPDRHLDRVPRAVTTAHLFDEADRPLHGRRWILLQAERERQVEQQLGICRSLDGGKQGLVYRKRELALEAGEVTHEAVVDPQPLAVAERVAVGLLDRRARRGADVGEEERSVDVARDLAQVAVVPGRLDGAEDGRDFGMGTVPADSEAVAVCGVDAETGVEALVYEGVVRLVEQLLDEDG